MIKVRDKHGWVALTWRRRTLNIGMVGYGFMGRTHSNAFSQVGHFFDLDLPARC